MKRLLLLCGVVFALSCVRDDQVDVGQKSAFKSYLEQSAYAGELQCDSLDGVWRLLENPRETRTDGALVMDNSEVEFYFEGYVFTSSINLDPTLSERPMPFYTNRKAMIEAMKIDARLWPTDAYTAKLGRGELFDGLERGLRGAYIQDSLLLLMTSKNSYDESTTGFVPKNTPLVFRVYVKNVK